MESRCRPDGVARAQNPLADLDLRHRVGIIAAPRRVVTSQKKKGARAMFRKQLLIALVCLVAPIASTEAHAWGFGINIGIPIYPYPRPYCYPAYGYYYRPYTYVYPPPPVYVVPGG